MSTGSSQQTHNFSSSTTGDKIDPYLPTMIVFDLDDCLWSPEMYTLSACPSIPQDGDLNPNYARENSAREIGVVGVQVPPRGPVVRLFDGARMVI